VRSVRYAVCDVFTRKALTGNPLAVFTDVDPMDDGLMKALAREMIYAESVFVLPPKSGGHARVRIFTVAREIPFAGHPVLGAAVVLGQGRPDGDLVMETGLGPLEVRFQHESDRVTFAWMQQPLPTWSQYPEARALVQALGLGGAVPSAESYDNGLRHVLIAAPSREEVGALRPDLVRLRKLPGLLFTVFAGEGTDWKMRVFAPAGGVDEDPASGSCAGVLAVHLARLGRLAFGTEIRVEQGAEIQRPSQLHARCTGSGREVTGVEVGGAAIVVARGEFQL
jgi:trans-2,3-dihydro-3-hydroxyanthranilate isomerase